MNNNFPEYFEDVDKEVYQYLNSENPSSFLLFAGAGSGKTRTLVNVLEHIKNNDLKKYTKIGGKIAVITYTNATCDEIKQRLKFDSAFNVSTIHSFAWDLIKPFSEDIREFLRNSLSGQIQELESKICKARDKNGITALKNARSRDGKVRRLELLDSIVVFAYSPSSGRPDRDALNHSEVIAIASEFIANNPLMQTLLVNRYPLLLVDESQDTEKNFMTSLIIAQQANQEKFVVGLFGDMMQRIYGGGKVDLDTALPEDWKKPAKFINYRSPKKIIKLINNIRMDVDGIQQVPKSDALQGIVRIFIVRSDVINKFQVEKEIRDKMSKITGDKKWNEFDAVKCLILEHAMAADRGGFKDFYLPLAKNQNLRDSVLDGSSAEIKFITSQVLPLIIAIKSDDLFEIARIVKSNSPLINNARDEFIKNPLKALKETDENIEKLKCKILNEEMTLRDILVFLWDYKVLQLPDLFLVLIQMAYSANDDEEIQSEDKFISWSIAIKATILQVQNYSDYVSGKSGFTTHQGVKGLEFDRVMAVLDDESSGGFLFKYEKLLGAESLSSTDLKNHNEGKDSTPLRTRRLFYVICSRAEKSLAIVAYTKDPDAVKTFATKSWFSEEEVIII